MPTRLHRLLLVLTAPLLLGAAPSRTYTYVTGQTIDASQVGTNEDNIYSYLQAGVDTYATGSVNAAAIADDAVGSGEIAADAVGTSEIATDGVGAAEIAAGAVGTSEAASLDISDDTNLTAGVGLTLTGDDVFLNTNQRTDVKCANINPNSAETDWFMWRAPGAITITGVDCIVEAATSVVLTPRHCNADGGTCTTIEAAMTCATTNTTEAGGIDSAAVAAGRTIRVTRGTLTGTVDEAFICVEFTIDD